jgi:NhaP-type Na+/H+ or K+/H+ antiporter
MLLMCWPVLTAKTGYGKRWDRKEMLVLVFCGLRGTVGLSLALIAEDVLRKRGEENDEKNGSLVLFNMAGIAFLTLLFNGSLVGVHSLNLSLIFNVRSCMKK